MDNIFDFPSDRPASASRVEEAEPVLRSKKRQSLSAYQVLKGKRTLGELVDRAFETLDEAMISADHATAIKAAMGVLDRAGFGPRSTLDVNQTTIDLSTLSRAQLAERAIKVANLIKERTKPKELNSGRENAIDVTPEPTIQ